MPVPVTVDVSRVLRTARAWVLLSSSVMKICTVHCLACTVITSVGTPLHFSRLRPFAPSVQGRSTLSGPTAVFRPPPVGPDGAVPGPFRPLWEVRAREHGGIGPAVPYGRRP
ncbi:hypothetical protein GCM10010121_016240 [Streptomyces brasiliensis]|uniref:Uncharacterized protein n=1 Tax=Streptomyces brasiliensis TaxID=1954 RepID=A0A917KA51_9ACTN|nr:hypothetical protein GCM10010121_016240 [Streptomyces brasiliensis]